VQNADNGSPSYATVCSLQKCQAVNPVQIITMKKLPCVVAEFYCHMNYSSEMSVDIATTMSECDSRTS